MYDISTQTPAKQQSLSGNDGRLATPSGIASVGLSIPVAQGRKQEKRKRGESEGSLGIDFSGHDFSPIGTEEEGGSKRLRPSCPTASDIRISEESSPKTGINGRESVINLPIASLSLKGIPVSR